MTTEDIPTSLETNPTFKEVKTGKFSPIVRIKYGNQIKVPVPFQIFVVTESDVMGLKDEQENPVNKTFAVDHAIKFETCDNQPVAKESSILVINVP